MNILIVICEFCYKTLQCPGIFTPLDVQRGGKITPHMYLEFWGTYGSNSNTYTHVFEVKRFNGANSYVAGSRYVTGNRYGVWQTKNNTYITLQDS